jgi:hypothetical protein
MNDTTRLEVRPDVADFLDKVRARLSDLTDEEREELLGGLEADLSELVADGGTVAELGDPRAYADELRSAAGLEHARRRAGRSRAPRRSTPEGGATDHDPGKDRWVALTASSPGRAQVWEVVQTLRPAWWVLRAWVAAQVLDLSTGPWEYATLIPRFGDDVSGKLILLGAVVVSVLLGLRRTWPASHSPRSVLARVVLLGLNSFAALMLLVVASSFPSSWTLNDAVYGGRAVDSARPAGLVNDGRTVRNVFAYDAEGNPLQGVQLYDQTGKPLAVDPDRVSRMRYAGRVPQVYSWSTGERDVWNVYPLPVASRRGWDRPDRVWTSDDPPFLPQPPFVVVPPVALPLPPSDEDGADKTDKADEADTARDEERPRSRR